MRDTRQFEQVVPGELAHRPILTFWAASGRGADTILDACKSASYSPQAAYDARAASISKDFLAATDPFVVIGGCAVCGEKTLDGCEVLPFADERILRLVAPVEAVKRQMHATAIDERYHCAFNIVHPVADEGFAPLALCVSGVDLVERRARVCKQCLSEFSRKPCSATGERRIPPFSIAAAGDFGNIPPFLASMPLSACEAMLLSPCLMHKSTIKITASLGVNDSDNNLVKLTQHVTMTPHDGIEAMAPHCVRAAAVSVPAGQRLVDCLQVVFVGPASLWSRLRSSTALRSVLQSSIRVHAAVLHQWYAFFAAVNVQWDSYSLGDLLSDDALHGIEQVLLDNALVVSNTHSILRDQQLAANHAGQRDLSYSDTNAVPRAFEGPVGSPDTPVPASLLEQDDASVARLASGRLDDDFIRDNMSSSAGIALPRTTVANASTDVLRAAIQLAGGDGSVDADGMSNSNHSLAARLNREAAERQEAARAHQASSTAPPIQVMTSPTPINEFSHGAEYVAKCFPQLFVLGTGSYATTSPSTDWSRHVLMQHDRRFGQCTDFILLIFNMMERHAVCRQVSASMQAGGPRVGEAVALLNDPSFLRRASDAMENPGSRDGVEMENVFRSVIRTVAPKVPFTPQSRAEVVSWVRAVIGYMGPPMWFLTLAPADQNSVLTLRISLGCDELDCTPETARATFRLPIHAVRAAIVAKDPAASTESYARLMRAFHEIVLRACVGSKHVPPPVGDPARPQGLFGTTLAFVSVPEEQVRIALHQHGLVWTAELNPLVLQKCLTCEAWLLEVQAELNRLLCASLPGDPADAIAFATENGATARAAAHAALPGTVFGASRRRDVDAHSTTVPDAARPSALPSAAPASVPSAVAAEPNCLLSEEQRAAQAAAYNYVQDKRAELLRAMGNHADFMCMPSPPLQDEPTPDERDACLAFLTAVVMICNSHRHSETCHKGAIGESKCRMLYGVPMQNNGSGPIAIKCPLLPGESPVVYQSFHQQPAQPHDPMADLADAFNSAILWEMDRRSPGVTVEEAAENFAEYARHSFAVYAASLDEEIAALRVKPGEAQAAQMPGPNSYYVQTSPLLSYLFKCNVNAQILSSGLSARIAAYYAADYLGKGGDEMKHLLALMVRGRQHIVQYPTVATDDADVAYLRDAKFFVEHLIMKINSSREVAVTTACLKLLGYESEMKSHALRFVFADQALRHAQQARAVRSGEADTAAVPTSDARAPTANISSSDGDVHDGTRDFTDELLRAAAHGVSETVEADADAGAPTGTFENRPGRAGVIVPAIHDYLFRSPELASFSLYEFTGMVKRRPMTPKELLAKQADASTARLDGASVARRDGDSTDGDTTEEDDEDTAAAPRQRGRKRSAVLALKDGHPLQGTDVLVISSKVSVPLIVGSSPPLFPGERPQCEQHDEAFQLWRQNADRFAAYWLVVMVPWVDEHGPSMPLTWESFVSWYCAGVPPEGDSGDAAPDAAAAPAPDWYYYIERCRRQAVHDLSHGLRFRKSDKLATRSTAARTTDSWSVDQRLQAAAAAADADSEATTSNAALLAASLQSDPLSATGGADAVDTQRALDMIRHARVLDCLQRIATAQTDQQSDVECDIPPSEARAARICALTPFTPTQSEAVWDALRKQPQRELPPVGASDQPGFSASARKALFQSFVRDVVPPPHVKLTAQQTAVFTKVVQFHNDLMLHRGDPATHPAPRQLLLAVLAPAGQGKSYAANVLYEVLPEGALFFIAPTGVAASLLPKGSTVHSLLGISKASSADGYSVDTPTAHQISTVAAHVGSNPSVCVLDELSMLSSELASKLQVRLAAAARGSQWGDPDKPFGGLAMLCFGDMHQIQPVKGTYIPQVTCRGEHFGSLFREFDIMILTGAWIGGARLVYACTYST
jgi:hypothetical protein